MTTLLRGLSGFVPIRNNIALDYTAHLSVKSLLPVCDEVVVSDSESSDGTREFFEEWATREPKLRVVNYPWPNPKGNVWFLKSWLNATRQHLRYDVQIALDGDEVLHPDAYPEIRRATAQRGCRNFVRLNFWKDAQHIVPDGMVCGRHVVRMGPTEYTAVSDNSEPDPEGELPIRKHALYHPKLLIFHLGFLRRQEPFLAKSRVMQSALLNTFDPRLAEAERTGRPWHELSNGEIPLERYEGKHPEIVREWLISRGYSA